VRMAWVEVEAEPGVVSVTVRVHAPTTCSSPEKPMTGCDSSISVPSLGPSKISGRSPDA